jgi:hypothetical protein
VRVDDTVRRSRRLQWANSAVAFALAGMVAVLLHETSHAVAGLVLGDRDVRLYGYQVSFAEPRPPMRAVATALTGPVFSLVLGAVVIATTRNAGRGFARLFFLWLGLISAQNFFGYLIIAPFGQVGDTGQALALLGAPTAVYVVLFVVGVAGTLALAYLFLSQLRRYADGASELRRLGVQAWLAGTAFAVVRTLLEVLPHHADAGVTVVVIAGAVASGIFAPILTPAWRRVSATYAPLSLRTPVVGLVLVVLLATVLVAGLSFGVPLG